MGTNALYLSPEIFYVLIYNKMKCKSQALEQLIDYLINCINQKIKINGIFLLGKCDGMEIYVCNKTFAVIRRQINQHIKEK